MTTATQFDDLTQKTNPSSAAEFLAKDSGGFFRVPLSSFVSDFYNKSEIDLMIQHADEFVVEVTAFSDLPVPPDNYGNGRVVLNNDVAWVKTATGIWGVNRKPAGAYRYNGDTNIWEATTDYQSVVNAIIDRVSKNTDITGATKTKITYDTKGLITSGEDATTADISDSTNRRYCTDSQKVIISSISGTNTGDETNGSIITKIGYTPQSTANLVTGFQATPDNTHYPSEKLVNDTFSKVSVLATTQTLFGNTGAVILDPNPGYPCISFLCRTIDGATAKSYGKIIIQDSWDWIINYDDEAYYASTSQTRVFVFIVTYNLTNNSLTLSDVGYRTTTSTGAISWTSRKTDIQYYISRIRYCER